MRPYNKHKLQPRSASGTFLEYSTHYKGYKVLLPSGKILVIRDILFDESVFPHLTPTHSSMSSDDSNSTPVSWCFPFLPPPLVFYPPPVSILASSPSISAMPSPPSSPSPVSPHFLSHDVSSPSSSSSSSSPSCEQHNNTEFITPSPPPTKISHPMITRAKAGIFKPKAFLTDSGPDQFVNVEPNTVSEALSSPLWREAMVKELRALFKNHTWTLTPQPADQNSIGCKWVFKLKRNADGSIARYKARLVAQGYTQEPGFDFTETFSPVVKPTTIRTILSLAIQQNWGVTHLDVDNAFLNGTLEETIYMNQPPGFEVSGSVPLVCKLIKLSTG